MRTLELDSNFAVAHLILGLAYAQQRSLGAAMSSVQRAIELSGGAPSTLAVAALGYVFALQDRLLEGWVAEQVEAYQQDRQIERVAGQHPAIERHGGPITVR